MRRLYLWPHRALYLGLSPDNELHRHHAAQLCVSLDAPLTVWQANEKAPSAMTGVLIPPDLPHRIDAGSSRILALYLEPESEECVRLLAPLQKDSSVELVSISPEHESIDALRHLADVGAAAGLAWNTCMQALGLGSSPPRPAERDARVDAVIGIIRSQLGRNVSVDELAGKVNLSQSRLIHLFSRDVGIPIRRFAVWWRMREAINRVSGGASLTEAAHAAGFSDAAHMSNTFRQMFGFAPSSLFTKPVLKDIQVIG